MLFNLAFFSVSLFVYVCAQRATERQRGGKEGSRGRVYHACALTEHQEQQTELERGGGERERESKLRQKLQAAPSSTTTSNKDKRRKAAEAEAWALFFITARIP